MSDLEMELQELKLMALHKRVLFVGASEESVEDAMNSSSLETCKCVGWNGRSPQYE